MIVALQYSQIQEDNKPLELNKPVSMYILSKNHLQLCISITLCIEKCKCKIFFKIIVTCMGYW